MEINTKLLLMPFCADSGDKRGYLHKPFQHGKYICATNGSIAVLVEGECDNQIDAEHVHRVFDKHLLCMPDDFCALPKICMPEKESDYEQCKECEGAGIVELDNLYNKYEFTCLSCEGYGGNEVRKTIKILNLGVACDVKFLIKILNLEGIMVAAVGEFLYFKFEQGVGFLKCHADELN